MLGAGVNEIKIKKIYGKNYICKFNVFYGVLNLKSSFLLWKKVSFSVFHMTATQGLIKYT